MFSGFVMKIAGNNPIYVYGLLSYLILVVFCLLIYIYQITSELSVYFSHKITFIEFIYTLFTTSLDNSHTQLSLF